ncbi:MAG: ParB N-terminal domain-containing protein [Pseudomonadota bacterium]
MTWVDDTILIRGEEVEVKRGKIDHKKLKFYPENPRLYSLVRPDEGEPDQEAIQRRLVKMDHVKELIQSIKENGGLMEPIFVHGATFEVLEGNSRLAAYRRLAENDPFKWAEMKCVLLPAKFEKERIFAFLGQLHIVGKKDWAPFEQAGFLYRRHKREGISVDDIAAQMNLPRADTRNLIKTYDYMLSVGDTDVGKWSYYFEYIRSRKIAGIIKKSPSFEGFLVDKIKTGEIKKAVDVRDSVPKLALAQKKLIDKVVRGDIDIYDAVERVEQSGNADSTYRRLKRFRDWLVAPETRAAIESTSDDTRKKTLFELRQIAKRTAQQLKRIE